MTTIRRTWPIALVIAAFVVLSAAFSIATPIFEAPDEPEHFFYARYLAQTWKLPLPEKDTLWAQEATQPPLYYALAAVPIALVDTSDAEQVAQRNPHAVIGIPLYPDNKNAYVHTPGEQFPWHDTVLAVHLARFLSVLLGAATVWITYKTGMELGLGSVVSLGAAAIVAFVPQFGFISGALNNDNLVTTLSASTLWMLVRYLRLGPSVKRALVLGLMAGLATLSKLSGAGLLALCGGACLVYACRRKDRAWLRDAAIILAVWAGIAGWWFVRNYALYGDFTGTAPMLEMMGSRTDVPNFPEAWDELRGLIWSFWGLFGWFNILAPYPMYKVFNVLAGAAAIGPVAWLLFRRKRNGTSVRMVWLAVWMFIMLAGLARWTAQTHASQGRLLFPALPALALILAAGWSALVPRRFRALALSVIAVVFLFWAARAPVFTILPAYAPPHTLADGALPEAMKPLDAVVGETATLVGYHVEPDTLRGGDMLTVNLCWRPSRQTEEKYSVYLHVLGRDGAIVGQRDTYPGGGSLPTTAWQPGANFCDAVQVPIADNAEGPAVLRMMVGLYDARTGKQMPVVDGLGRATTIMEDIARLAGGEVPPLPNAAEALLGGEIQLVGWDASFQTDNPNRLQVALHWRAVSVPSGDYTVFVHLLDADGNTVAQHDGIPVAGDYPTLWWLPDQGVEDPHSLEADSPIPTGVYMIQVGMYRTGNPEQRLSVTEGGADVPEMRVLLGPVIR